MLRKPEEIKKSKKKAKSWERMPRSESRKVNKPRRNQKNKNKVLEQRMPRPSDYLSQGLDFLFCFFFDFLKVFHFSRSESRKVNTPRRNQKSQEIKVLEQNAQTQ